MSTIISQPVTVALGSISLSFRLKTFCRPPQNSRLDDLPMELVTEIFRHVVKSSPDPRLACRSAFIISTVNRLWRSYALGDPKLWSPICFMPPRRSQGSSAHLEQSTVCLQRAGEFGIDIRIIEVGDGEQDKEFREDEVIKVVAALSVKFDCIKHLRVQLKSPHIISTFLHALQAATTDRCLRQLQTLDLRCTRKMLSSFGSRSPVAPIRLLEATPSLKAWVIDGVHFDWPMLSSPHPLALSIPSCLTVIHLAGLSIHQWPTVMNFRQFLQPVSLTLRRLVLNGAGPAYVLSHLRQPATAFSSSIPLPGLISLELSGFTSDYAGYVFDLLDCPNLRNLTIRSFDIHDCESIVMALTGKAHRVEKLALYSQSSRSLQNSRTQLGSSEDALLTLATRKLLVAWLNSIPRLRLLVVDQGGIVALQALLKAEVIVLTD
ncbi:hypothetical protein CPB83DRAFT_919156 [Crepidotus variabilis]|uniref:F-box domain-containing protein n=1 Tax=Crepidotus variabilis TaxID=179855 RepID=A0A9P6EK75_9AGAR|nr:hypothetical protein CPB83DRAFT_919156 [Crepidotus variabilis]